MSDRNKMNKIYRTGKGSKDTKILKSRIVEELDKKNSKIAVITSLQSGLMVINYYEEENNK